MTLGFVLQRKPAPDARVLKIRDYEDRLYTMQHGVQVSVLVVLRMLLPAVVTPLRMAAVVHRRYPVPTCGKFQG